MKTYYLNVPYFVIEFEKHKLLKKELLHLLSKVQDRPLDGVSKTDWDIKQSQQEYKELITPFFLNVIKNLFPDKTMKIVNCWFQEYKKYSYHSWHNHGMCWALVYYLSLPEDSKGTVFKDFVSAREYDPQCKEGDFLIFPGWITHKSPINRSIDNKVIIACNFEEVLIET